MTRILVKTFLLIALAGLVVSCSDSFNQGQKVWISIPGTHYADEGFAIARVIAVRDKGLLVKASKVVSTRNGKTVHALRTGRTLVPRGWAKEYRQGKKRYSALRSAHRKLLGLIAGNAASPQQDIAAIIKTAKAWDVKELLDVARLMKLGHRYLGEQLSLEDRIENIPSLMKGIRSLARDNMTWRHMINRINARVTARPANGKQKKRLLRYNMRLVKLKPEERRNRSRYRVFVRQGIRLVARARHLLDSLSRNRMSALWVTDNMSDVMNAEEAWLEFVTDNSRRSKGLVIDKALAYRRTRLVRALVPALRQELKIRHNLDRVTSIQQAESKARDIMAAAGKLQKKFGVRIFSKKEKNRTFISPAKRRLVNLRRNEESVYRLALDKTLEPKYQKEMIQRYLRHYPKGRYRKHVEAQLDQVGDRQSAYASTQRKTLEQVTRRLNLRKPLRGTARIRDKVQKFRLRVARFDEGSGRFSGRLVWPGQKGAAATVSGRLDTNDGTLNFRETRVLRKGTRHGLSRFEFDLTSRGKLKGTHAYRVLFLSEKKPAVLSLK